MPCDRVYATTGDYRDHFGEPAPRDMDRRLFVRCSRRIDRALLGAVYATDDAGYPTDPRVRQALREATCAQAGWLWDNGDRTGTGVQSGGGSEYDEVAIGDVRLKRRSGPSTSTTAADGTMRLAPEVGEILAAEGLTPIHPMVDG